MIDIQSRISPINGYKSIYKGPSPHATRRRNPIQSLLNANSYPYHKCTHIKNTRDSHNQIRFKSQIDPTTVPINYTQKILQFRTFYTPHIHSSILINFTQKQPRCNANTPPFTHPLLHPCRSAHTAVSTII